jgi:hypothetical protein
MKFIKRLFGHKSDKAAQSASSKIEYEQDTPIAVRQEDGWMVLLKKSHTDGAITLYRERSDAQPLSDEAVIVGLAAAFVKMPSDKQTAHLQQTQGGRQLVVKIDSASSVLKTQPPKEWDVPCYMVCLYDNILDNNKGTLNRYELYAVSAGMPKDQGHIEVFENVELAKAYCEKGSWDFAAIRDRSTGQAIWYWACPATEEKWRWITAKEFDTQFPK